MLLYISDDHPIEETPVLNFSDICIMGKLIVNMVLAVMCLLSAVSAMAQQQKPIPARARELRKGMLPVFRSALGNVPSNTLPASMMQKLLDSTLVARDKKGQIYPVVAFDFGYLQSHNITNDTTGRQEIKQSYLSWHFERNELDSLWRNRIKRELHKGDKLYFEKIIAEDTGGIKYLSSSLYYTIN